MTTISDANIDRFNQLAAEWDEAPMRVGVANAIADALIAGIRPDKQMQALEFGAGTGLVTLRLAAHLASVVAMDSSAGMLDVLAQKAEKLGQSHVSTLVGEVPQDLPAGPFDLIFCSMTLHHIEDIDAVFAACHARLAPGGRVAFVDLDSEDGSFHGDMPGIAHLGFARDAIQQMLARAGFGDIALTTAHTIQKPQDDGSQRPYPLFLALARKAG